MDLPDYRKMSMESLAALLVSLLEGSAESTDRSFEIREYYRTAIAAVVSERKRRRKENIRNTCLTVAAIVLLHLAIVGVSTILYGGPGFGNSIWILAAMWGVGWFIWAIILNK